MQEIKEKIISVRENRLVINKKKVKFALVAIILIFFAVYITGEVAVRIFDPQILYNDHDPAYPSYPKEVEYDADLGWSTVKDYKVMPHTYQGRKPVITITHNKEGFRMDHEVGASKNMVVMTGDSLTYGFWVDDKKVVSKQLNNLLGNNWEVINLGVGGYGTDQAFLRFIRDGLKYKPKAVVHVLFNNDFSNIVSNYQYDVYKPLFKIGNDGRLQLTNEPVPVSPDMERSYPKIKEDAYKGFDKFMRTWSHFYILYNSKISQIKSAMKDFFNPPEKKDYFDTYKDGEFWAIERNYTDTMKYSFYLNSLIIKEYSNLAKQNNITFILVVIGDRISVDQKKQKDTVEQYYNINDDFFDYEKPYRLLDEFAKRENIKIVDLYPVFKKEFNEEKKDPYLDGDAHLGDYGQEVFAREVYRALKEEGVIENG